MKRILALAPTLFLAAGLAQAQPAAPAGAPPTGLVVGSGNYFSPIVRDLDAAIAFYRDGLGLEVQGAPGDASANPALRDMFGLPDAQIRWAIARTPAMTGGVEMVEIKNAGGKAARAAPRRPRRDLIRRDGARSRRHAGAPQSARRTDGVPQRRAGDDRRRHAHRHRRRIPTDTSSSSRNPRSCRARCAGRRERHRRAAAARGRRRRSGRAALPRRARSHGARTARRIRQQRCRAGRARFGERPVSRRVSRTCRPRGSCTTSSISKASNERTCRGEFKTSARRVCNCAFATSTRRSPCSSASAPKSCRPAACRSRLPAGNSTLKVAIVRDSNNLFVVLIEAPPAA